MLLTNRQKKCRRDNNRRFMERNTVKGLEYYYRMHLVKNLANLRDKHYKSIYD